MTRRDPPSPTRGEGEIVHDASRHCLSRSTPHCRSTRFSISSATLAAATPRCWSRRPAPARPRACRSRCWTRPGASGGKIIVLEPRRLAARAAARRMAQTLGEQVGETVGYRVRLGLRSLGARPASRSSPRASSRRMILDDPELSGVAAVLFDEFHERSLDADLGLALALDAQAALREDLRILVMSATLDGARVGRLLGDAPVIESEGRAFPVETHYLGRDPHAPLERQVADAMRDGRCAPSPARCWSSCRAQARDPPHRRAADGARFAMPMSRSRRCSARWTPREQDRAVAPAPTGRRKVVLATSIAETSLTIEGVRVVVDCGLARVPRYEPDDRPDAAGDRARLARRGRPAARPRRPHRARRVLPAVGRGRRPPRSTPSPSPRSSPPISPRWCSISRLGRARSGERWRCSIRRRRRR